MSRYLSKYPLLPQQPIEWLLALLFLISPFYLVSSLGGTGFDLPFNITVWAAATLVIAYSVWYFCGQDKLILPANYKGLLALPVGILLAAALAGVKDPITWLFRITYVIAGVLFLFGLFQFRLKNTDRILLMLAVATLLHGLFGIVQLFQPPLLVEWIPKTNTQIATGIFQQVNVMASFLVTGILICIYLCLRPIAYKRFYLKLFLLLTISVANYVMVSTGSRIGLLSGLFGLALLLIGYRNQVRKNWKTIIAVVLLIIAASWLAKEGLHKTLDKTYQVIEAQYSDQRLSIYRISLDAFSEAPIRGHGIGTFMEKFGFASSRFYQQHPAVELPIYLGHPHNELLQWGIEGGLLSLMGILVALYSVFWFAIKHKQQRFIAYLALLLPITFHTQVEHPFYISSLHWFVWLIILFVLLNHYVVIRNNLISTMTRNTLKVVSLLILVIGLLFTIHSLFAQKQLYAYAKGIQDVSNMRLALSNPYFKRVSEQVVIRANLHDAIALNEQDKISKIATWLEAQIAFKPELPLFGDLLEAYTALNEQTKKCLVADLGVKYYPTHRTLKEIAAGC